MKTSVKALILAVTAYLPAVGYAQQITTFGNNAFSDFGWVWNGGANSVTGIEGTGNVLYGETLFQNYTGINAITLTASVSVAPNAGFQFVLLDNTDKQLVASFDWLDFAGGATVTSTVSSVDVGFNYSNVIGWNLVSGGSNASINAIITNALAANSAIPEPSTAAALGGLAILGFAAARRQRRSA